MIQDNADESDPVLSLDPIAFISVFALMLVCLVPREVVQGRKGEIYEVMGELAGIVVEEDTSSWPDSRKGCVESACKHLCSVNIQFHDLISKLTKFVDTWNPWVVNPALL